MREQIALATAGLCLFVSLAIAFGAAYVGRQEAARLVGREMIQISETTSDRIDRYFYSRLSPRQLVHEFRPDPLRGVDRSEKATARVRSPE